MLDAGTRRRLLGAASPIRIGLRKRTGGRPPLEPEVQELPEIVVGVRNCALGGRTITMPEPEEIEACDHLRHQNARLHECQPSLRPNVARPSRTEMRICHA